MSVRSVAGIFNGNVGVAKAYIADITTEKNRSFAFSIIAISFSIGIILGSTCGGALINSFDADDDDVKSESILPFEPFKTQFPYLFPCLIGSVLSLIATIFTIINVTDSNPTDKKIKKLLKPIKEGEYFNENSSILSFETYFSDVIYNNLWELIIYTSLGHNLIVYSCLLLFLVGWNAVTVLYLAQTLDFDSLEIGIYMTWTGIVLLLFTWFIQPILLKKYTYKYMLIVCGIIQMIICIIFPTVSILINIDKFNKILLVCLMSFIGGWKHGFATMLFVISTCFINNCVPPKYVGRAHGLSQSVASGFRGLGPLIGGSIWSYAISNINNKYYVYLAFTFLFAFIFWTTIHTKIFIDKDLQKPWIKQHKNRKHKYTSNKIELYSNE